ncbi:hypothetical protein HOLleu_30837 [Holothuria leucospilota]|uniref:Uncharacterized protein n=1 Tax=Holothuria leucospilota TaxID=206669 RepID=A0A9Q1H0V5_HOLLE|nr:hypothetical protein HOLleu_30837 [Holothuria leucospilota]
MYADHYFPTNKGYKILPSGHVILKDRPSFRKTVHDKLGHEAYQFPRTGPTFAFDCVAIFQNVKIHRLITGQKEKEIIMYDAATD